MSFIPCYNLGAPGIPGGLIQITPNTPIYSSYTGDLIGYGSIPIGTICDAPRNNQKYNQPFHVIEKDSNGNFMAHRQY